MELEYIKIKTSGGYMYGGDQKLFGEKVSKSGCGMIAACDMILFLRKLGSGNFAPVSFSEYVKFVEKFRDEVAYKNSSNPLGIFPGKLAKMLNRSCGSHTFKFYGRKKFRKENDLAECISNSVKNGLPVIVRIGLNGKRLNCGICYPASGNVKKKCVLNWHYVTVTGISENGTLTFSSWGGKGTMSCADLKRHFGITGGAIIANPEKRLSK